MKVGEFCVFFHFPTPGEAHRYESWHVDGEEVVWELPLELETFKTIKIQQTRQNKNSAWLLQTIMILIAFQQLGLGQSKKWAKVA